MIFFKKGDIEAGNGPMWIVKVFKTDKVLTTRAYYVKQKGKLLPK